MDHFPAALQQVVHAEGGVSSDPKDTAGDGSGKPHTNLGITLKTVRSLDADGKLSAFLTSAFDVDDDGDIDSDDVPGWTHDMAAAFYLEHYWLAAACDRLPWPMALLMFDQVVNMGVAGGVKAFQVAIGVKPDGIVGPQTLRVAARLGDSDEALRRILAARLEINRHAKTADDHFFGWARRCFELYHQALKEAA